MSPKKMPQTVGPEMFLNRHYGWMQFNDRVLEEAQDASNPLLERLKFLAITASNLDEFVEVRVAGILQQVEHGKGEIGPDGSTPQQTLDTICSTYGLTWYYDGSFLYIDPADQSQSQVIPIPPST